MKKALRSYTTFSRTERIGLLALSALLLLLLLVRITLHYWVHPHIDEAKQAAYSAAWKNFQTQQAVAERSSDSGVSKPDNEERNKGNKVNEAVAIININTADSETLISLNGVGPATAHKIIERRKTKGFFKNIEELEELPRVQQAKIEALKAQISFGKE